MKDNTMQLYNSAFEKNPPISKPDETPSYPEPEKPDTDIPPKTPYQTPPIKEPPKPIAGLEKKFYSY